MHDHRPIMTHRLRRTFEEVIIPAEYTVVAPLQLQHHEVTDEGGVPGQGEPISFGEAMTREFTDVEWPCMWGPGWGTTWFKVSLDIPEQVRGAHLECVFDLSGARADDGPGFQAEALVYLRDGTIVKAINPRNRWVPIDSTQEHVEFYLEAASNPPMEEGHPFGPTQRGDKETVGPQPQFGIAFACLSLVNDDVRELIADIRTLRGLADVAPEGHQRRARVDVALDRALDAIDVFDVPSSAAAARERLAPVLADKAPGGEHEISAIGHAHIDTAWLWPLRETRRKVARTMANVLRLIDDGTGVKFALPAAQHMAWLAEDQPELFARVKKAVEEGHIIPVGGMWVEPDAVLPGSEAMARQLVYGERFFEEELGTKCRGVWLPDSFGYSGALPQLAVLAGMDWFVTQKISWNQVNKFPHHTFWWEGIDGTRIYTHFPPIDTYNSDLSVPELNHAVWNFRDKGKSTYSLAPFGWGDGGGGPTREMVWQANRVRDLAGVPKVTIESPDAFFDKAREEYPDAGVWHGELYLELHRGTFTSQVETKAGNRRNEALLHEAELWCTTAAVYQGYEYPAAQLERIWKEILTGQFHDILPGSSIHQVYRENDAMHERISKELLGIIEDALAVLTAGGDEEIVVHAAPYAMDAIPVEEMDDVAVEETDATLVLDNGTLRVTIDRADGLVSSIVDLDEQREVLPPGTKAGLLQLHPDVPNQWDAWDIDEFYRRSVSDILDVREITVHHAPTGAAWVRVTRDMHGAAVHQTIALEPGGVDVRFDVDVDWQLQKKLLKLAFPVDVHATEAKFETQFGHVTRPITENTSWDAARFELSCHRWLHVADGSWGVAIANEHTYGWDVSRMPREGGGSATMVRASLVRGAMYPDPTQDLGPHSWSFRLEPRAQVSDAIDAGYRANLPERRLTGTPFAPLVESQDCYVETVKMADDGSGDIILRVYEPYGGRSTGTLTLGFDATGVTVCDLLERPLPEQTGLAQDEDELTLDLHAFQVVTLSVAR